MIVNKCWPFIGGSNIDQLPERFFRLLGSLFIFRSLVGSSHFILSFNFPISC